MKKLTKTLIDKWSRAIYEINIDYTDLEDTDRHTQHSAVNVRESNMHKIIAQD
jgi:hypothetical protein